MEPLGLESDIAGWYLEPSRGGGIRLAFLGIPYFPDALALAARNEVANRTGSDNRRAGACALQAGWNSCGETGEIAAGTASVEAAS